jgi:hypothetical protein
MSDVVNRALLAAARSAVRSSVIAVGVCGLATLGVLGFSLWDVGARAPVDLPLLCVAGALAVGTVLAILARRERAALIAQVTAADLVGVTRRPDNGLWLHFPGGRSFLVPSSEVPQVDLAALPALPAPAKNYTRLAIQALVVLAPLGLGAYFNEQPVPATIAQVKATRGVVQLTGNAVEAGKATYKIGTRSPEYAVLRLEDRTGNSLIYVELAALPPEALDRARTPPGLPMRVVARPKKVKHEGVAMPEIEVLVVESFELLNRT